MHFGLVMECVYRYGSTLEDSFRDVFSLARECEEGGLDGVWLAERHFAAPRNPLDAQGAGIPSIVSVPLIIASLHSRNRSRSPSATPSMSAMIRIGTGTARSVTKSALVRPSRASMASSA